MKATLLLMVLAFGVAGLAGCSSSTSGKAAGDNGGPPPENSGAGDEAGAKKGVGRLPAPK